MTQVSPMVGMDGSTSTDTAALRPRCLEAAWISQVGWKGGDAALRHGAGWLVLGAV